MEPGQILKVKAHVIGYMVEYMIMASWSTDGVQKFTEALDDAFTAAEESVE